MSLTSDDHPDLIRGLLAIHTVCYCCTILLRSTPHPDTQIPVNDKVAEAALEATALLRAFDLPALRFVDPVLGASIC